ncbi:MAG: SDR family NAD(P)-dependent oxidoreductase [Rhodobacteraceae bacterium]|nr:SDR family NAD(P)-dependent oxidoreductase [Paracoccaceae bacterium]
MQEFQDKVVVITGGATGIGFSLARQLGQEGARLILAGRRQDRLDEAVAELAGCGIRAMGRPCDVTVPADVEGLADFAWDRCGQVDAIINNAGIPPVISTTINAKPEDIERNFKVNVFGVWNGVSVFGKRFIKAGHPSGIYAVGSENSLFFGAPGGAMYVAAKHALHGMMDALRSEAPEFLRIGLILPGFVKSEIGDNMDTAMDTDRYTRMVVEQIRQGEFYIVSHAHNMVHINKRYQEITAAYAKYAPRYKGDEEFDLLTMLGSGDGSAILGPR